MFGRTFYDGTLGLAPELSTEVVSEKILRSVKTLPAKCFGFLWFIVKIGLLTAKIVLFPRSGFSLPVFCASPKGDRGRRRKDSSRQALTPRLSGGTVLPRVVGQTHPRVTNGRTDGPKKRPTGDGHGP